MAAKAKATSKPVAGYFRISKARDDMAAPEIYRGRIEDYCRYKNLDLGHVFSDVDFYTCAATTVARTCMARSMNSASPSIGISTRSMST